MSEPRILFFDIETAGVNALKSDLGFCIMVGYKWSDEKQVKIITASKNDLKHFNDKPLLTKFSKLYEQADLTAAHFGSVFDRRFIQGRILINKLPAIPFTRMRDTCMIARSVANFSSNRLKHLCKILNLGNQKLENDWPMAWFRVMQGDMKALHAMEVYCKGDVLALEELYYALRPLDNAHPRIYMDRDTCGSCGGPIVYRGFAFAANNKYHRYLCTNKNCGKWSRGRTAVK